MSHQAGVLYDKNIIALQPLMLQCRIAQPFYGVETDILEALCVKQIDLKMVLLSNAIANAFLSVPRTFSEPHSTAESGK